LLFKEIISTDLSFRFFSESNPDELLGIVEIQQRPLYKAHRLQFAQNILQKSKQGQL